MRADPIPALLAGISLLALPGAVLLGRLSPRAQRRLQLDEALWLWLAVGAAWAAWLGLVLAELELFSLARAGVITAVASVPLLARGARWPFRSPMRPTALAATLLVAVVAVALQARPSEYIVGGRDPGAYAGAMALIGRTGALASPDPAVLSIPAEAVPLFYRHPENPPFSWARFMGFHLESPKTGRVFPQFFHLFPAFGAFLFQAMGLRGALATPSVFGVLATVGVYLCARRIVGTAAALVAALLLGTNVIQVWFARFPASEIMSQFLIFLGMLALWHGDRGARAFLALSGAAFGLSLLVRIDSVLIAAPVLAVAAVRLATGRWSQARTLTFLGPFAFFAAHAGVHAALFARKYALDVVNRPYWRQPPMVWMAATAVLGVLGFAIWRYGGAVASRLARHERRGRHVVIAVVGVLALYAYFLRPELSAWAGGDGNDPALRWVDPSWLHLLGFRRLAAHDAQALVRFAWFVHPLGLILGLIGFAALIRRARARDTFLVVATLAFGLFYFYKIRVYNDYYFALRRYVPLIVPALLMCAGHALALAARRDGWRRAVAVATLAFVGLTYARDTSALVRHVDWEGAVDYVDDLARRFGPDDVVVFEQTASIHLLSLPLWAAHGVNVLELARFNPDPAILERLVEVWRRRYRNVYFVYTYRSELCSLYLQRVQEFQFTSREWERGYVAPPRRAEGRLLRFTVSRVVDPEALRVPPVEAIDIGGTDDLYVSAGFHDKESNGARRYRWTGRCATVYLPGARPGATVTITASVGPQRPEEATATLTFSGAPLGTIDVDRTWRTHSVTLPDPLPDGEPILRIDVPDWRPVNVLADSTDTRDLGILVDRIEVTPP